MQHALKLALIDPRHAEYRELNKTAADQSRVHSSLEMKRILDSSEQEAPDVKLKRYGQALNKFLNAGSVANEQPLPPINWTPSPVKKKKKKKKQREPHVNVRRSSRPHKLSYDRMKY